MSYIPNSKNRQVKKFIFKSKLVIKKLTINKRRPELAR